VRNHGGIPEIEEAEYFFDVGGLVNEPKRITLAMLKDEKLFPRETKTVTIQCSGTRRIEQIHQYPGDGDELINAPVSSFSSFYRLLGRRGNGRMEDDKC
jgi:sulfite oxidase